MDSVQKHWSVLLKDGKVMNNEEDGGNVQWKGDYTNLHAKVHTQVFTAKGHASDTYFTNRAVKRFPSRIHTFTERGVQSTQRSVNHRNVGKGWKKAVYYFRTCSINLRFSPNKKLPQEDGCAGGQVRYLRGHLSP